MKRGISSIHNNKIFPMRPCLCNITKKCVYDGGIAEGRGMSGKMRDVVVRCRRDEGVSEYERRERHGVPETSKNR